MTVDRLWYLADRAEQRAEQVYHDLTSDFESFIEYSQTRAVSRPRFRTLAQRIDATGTPFGAHTIPYRPSGEILLVRHDGVDEWVLPGGEVGRDESLHAAARRELDEEAGIDASYDGLGLLGTVHIQSGRHATWGLIPVYEAEAITTVPTINDPDGEISAASWFQDLPADTRDRPLLREWRDQTPLVG
jgi:8-oxo-dGTP pyrophosphatase MutT (NUDIX family)